MLTKFTHMNHRTSQSQHGQMVNVAFSRQLAQRLPKVWFTLWHLLVVGGAAIGTCCSL
jgi:hypothetical protein